jgi:hypothetical protein
MPDFDDGYYWAADSDGLAFVVLLEDGFWYCCAQSEDMNDTFSPNYQIICPIQPPRIAKET